jgi:hypothetical protein
LRWVFIVRIGACCFVRWPHSNERYCYLKLTMEPRHACIVESQSNRQCSRAIAARLCVVERITPSIELHRLHILILEAVKYVRIDSGGILNRETLLWSKSDGLGGGSKIRIVSC